MPLEEILTAADPRVAEYRSVSDPALARDKGLFIVEGRMILRRLVDDGRFRVRSVLVSPQGRRALEPALTKLDPDVPVYVCRAADFLPITGFNIHRGCLALAERPPALSIDQIAVSGHSVVVLESVANADNVGGVFRNAAAFGVSAVLLSPSCCDPLYRKAIRTSMGAALSVPFVWLAGWPSPLNVLREAGFALVALTPHGGAEAIDAVADALQHRRKLALMIGHEDTGLTPAAESMADVRVRIPMHDRVDSLNLSVASGIALYRLAGSRDPGLGVRCRP